MVVLLAAAPGHAQQSAEETTAVLCDPKDPYYPLALEISQTESLPVYTTMQRALARAPRYLLWVGAPASFDDSALVHFGLRLRAVRSMTSVGLISGRTQGEARALWQRAKKVRGERVYAVNGEYPEAGIREGRILSIGDIVHASALLTKSSLADVLKSADYLTFTGHGGASYWRLAEGIQFTSADMPAVPPVVLATASCAAFRPTSDSSMALSAVSRGAAGYAGYLFSPIEGYLIGEFDGLPFRYTWPGMTVGDIVQIQNSGAVRAFAAFPFYFFLGDPRLSLQAEPISDILRIETVRGVRSLNYGETSPGFYPLRIKDGARYHYVEVPGVAAATDDDVFYNSRLQLLNVGTDKLVLLYHAGGDLMVRLRAEAPRFWRLSDIILDSLDHSFVYLPRTGGRLLPAVTVVLALTGIILLLQYEKRPAMSLLAAVLGGLAMGLSQMLYISTRMDQITVTSKPVTAGAADVIGTALLASCGVILYMQARSISRRLAAVAVAVLPTLGAVLFSFSSVTVFNSFFARPKLGTGLYNYSMTLMALIGLACQAALFLAWAALLKRAWRRQEKGLR